MRGFGRSLHRQKEAADIVPREDTHDEYDACEDDIDNVNCEFVVYHRGPILARH